MLGSTITPLLTCVQRVWDIYSTSYQKLNILCPSYRYEYGCATRYGYGYRYCISHIVRLKSKQDGGIRSDRH